MIGQKFGRWTVLGEGEAVRYQGGTNHRRMFCRCDCGTERLVYLSGLRSGKTSSCGCLLKERARDRRYQEGALTHNMRIIVDGFLGWTTEYLNFVPVSNTYALVDEEDFAELSQMNWYLITIPKSDLCYASTKIKRGQRWYTVRMHQFILPLPKGTYIDHKNHNGLDNRRENLRPASQSQNCANQRIQKTSKNGSQFKGVWRNGNTWQAGLRRRHLGSFSSEREAALAYNEAAKKHFGEFALINEIPSLATEVQISSKEAVQS